jgi:hypothetical protein
MPWAVCGKSRAGQWSTPHASFELHRCRRGSGQAPVERYVERLGERDVQPRAHATSMSRRRFSTKVTLSGPSPGSDGSPRTSSSRSSPGSVGQRGGAGPRSRRNADSSRQRPRAGPDSRCVGSSRSRMRELQRARGDRGCPHDAVTSRADLGLAWRSAIKDGKTHVLPAADEQVATRSRSVIPGSG